MKQPTIEGKSNKVIDLKSKEVISSTAEIKVNMNREGTKPDDTGAALLQAKHLLNEAQNITKEAIEHGYAPGISHLVGNKYLLIKIHYYAWGLFKNSILKATKDREDLKAWSPRTFAHDQVCEACSGKGKLEYPIDGPEYKEVFEDFGDITWGTPIWKVCQTCNGVGILHDSRAYRSDQS